MLNTRKITIGVAAGTLIAVGVVGEFTVWHNGHAASAATAAAPSNRQEADLSQILDGLQGTNVSAQIESSAPFPFDTPDGSTWLATEVPAPASRSGPLDAYEPSWAAGLVAGALRDMSAGQGLSPVAGYSEQWPTDPIPRVGHRIDGTLGDANAIVATQDDSALTDRIRSNAAAAGLTIDSLTLYHPMGPAVVVVASTSDAAGFVKGYAAMDIFGSLNDYDGVLLVVNDDQGLALVSDWATRIESGDNWVRPDISAGQGGDAPPIPTG
jgi:hypothetical protein